MKQLKRFRASCVCATLRVSWSSTSSTWKKSATTGPVEKRLKDCLKSDRARIQVGRISHFGLMEMSRQRIRTGVLESSMDPCPHCHGTGYVRASASVALLILRSIEDHLLKGVSHHVVVKTRGNVALYILNQKRQNLFELESRFGVNISIEVDDHLEGKHLEIERGEPLEQPVAPTPTVSMLTTDDLDEDLEFEAEMEREQEEESSSKKRRRRRRRKKGNQIDARGGQMDDDAEGDEDEEASETSQQSEADGEEDGDDKPQEKPSAWPSRWPPQPSQTATAKAIRRIWTKMLHPNSLTRAQTTLQQTRIRHLKPPVPRRPSLPNRPVNYPTSLPSPQATTLAKATRPRQQPKSWQPIPQAKLPARKW